jgi:uncharacterized membrane protein
MATAVNFFTEIEKQQIIEAIRQAEDLTSGELRVHIEEKCGGDVFTRGLQVFGRLNMNQTVLRNGVLIYLAVKDKQFAIVADEAINAKMPSDFWDNVKTHMQQHFVSGNFLPGLLEGIQACGLQLQNFFPLLSGDMNELSNELSFQNE